MRKLSVIVAFLLLALPIVAQESVTLTTPIAKPPTASCGLDSVFFDIKGARIVAALSCNNGDALSKQYDAFSTPTGAFLLSSLNISNNTPANSLIKKVYTRLIADGVISGTVTGTAQ